MKTRVAILMGGRSSEHEVSLLSAMNIASAIDRAQFEVLLVGISKAGKWYLLDEDNYLENADDPKLISLAQLSREVRLVPGEHSGRLVELSGEVQEHPVDVVFPVLHGPYGEDGSIQGLFKLCNTAFVGSGILGSAICMDKVTTKQVLRDAGISVSPSHFLTTQNRAQANLKEIINELGLPLYVKPANMGSSIGISRVTAENSLQTAIDLAFEYDRKILIEKGISGREIECAVLGNEDPIASVLGEIVPDGKHGFYSYDAKYIDESGARLMAPASLTPELEKILQNLAIKAFQATSCEGMARVDFFLNEENQIYVNEINTIPGFTNISMYPRLWELSGASNTELVTRLIRLGIERFHAEKKR